MFNLLFTQLAIVSHLSTCSVAEFLGRSFSVYQFNAPVQKIFFIGEVKGHSYIKLELEPVKMSSEFVAQEDEQLKYKGSYYESASERKLSVTAVFSVQERIWTFRCFNAVNRQILLFKGKQLQDGTIDGTWSSKGKTCTFYLRPQ